MADPVFSFFLLAAALLAVGVACLRLRRVEGSLARLQQERREEEGGSGAEPDRVEDLDERQIRALFWSPLSVILVQCSLARETGDPERRIAIIERHACRLRDLLDMQRLPGLSDLREKRAIDPAEAIRVAVQVHAGLALRRGVTVHVMPEPTPPLLASPTLLAHGLRHLVRAAIEAARPETGDVTVATGLLPLQGEPTHVAFAVADDGPGIDPVRLARLATPAEQGRQAMQGPDLSHAIVDAVALALGAEFTVDSLPGEGTRATLKVPLAPAWIEGAHDDPRVPRPAAARTQALATPVGRARADRGAAPDRDPART